MAFAGDRGNDAQASFLTIAFFTSLKRHPQTSPGFKAGQLPLERCGSFYIWLRQV